MPKKIESKYFSGVPGSLLHACVGRNGGPATFDRYARGYFETAALAAEKAILQGGHALDWLVYPVCFCLRHAVELEIKHFSRELSEIFDESIIFKHNHNLPENWRTIRPHLFRLSSLFVERFCENDIVLCDEIIEELEVIDPTGQAFRFPELKSGKDSLEDYTRLHLPTVLELIKKLDRATFQLSTELHQLQFSHVAKCMVRGLDPVPGGYGIAIPAKEFNKILELSHAFYHRPKSSRNRYVGMSPEQQALYDYLWSLDDQQQVELTALYLVGRDGEDNWPVLIAQHDTDMLKLSGSQLLWEYLENAREAILSGRLGNVYFEDDGSKRGLPP